MCSRSLLLLTLVAATAVGQAPEPTLYDFQLQAREEAAAKLEAQKAAAEKFVKESYVESKAVEAKTTAAVPAAPDPFASRIHATYQDFFSLISVAISSVEPSTNGQSLAIRLRPPMESPVLVAGSVIITKPNVYDNLSGALPLDVRASVTEEVRKQLSDFDDLTYGLAVTPSGTCDLESAGPCFGKDPASYRDSLSRLLSPRISPDSTEQDKLNGELRALLRGKQSYEVRPSDLAPKDRDHAVDVAKRIGVLEAGLSVTGLPDMETYTKLLENQPQIAGQLSYRARGTYGGPDEFTASAELVVGGANLNTVKKKLKAKNSTDIVAEVDGLKDHVSSSRFSLAASYKRRTAFSLTTLSIAGSGGTSTSYAVGLAEPSADEFSGKLQWGTALQVLKGERQPRFDMAGEGIVTRKDSVREKNRWVATGTLTIPFGDTLSIPLSVTWANRGEFLGDQRRLWGAHLGISYRLPWEVSASK